MKRVVDMVEAAAHRAGIDKTLQVTVGLSSGKTLWSFRYSTEEDSRALFYTEDVAILQDMYPDNHRSGAFDKEAVAVVSEPMSDLDGVWLRVPESSVVVVNQGTVALRPFEPVAS